MQQGSQKGPKQSNGITSGRSLRKQKAHWYEWGCQQTKCMLMIRSINYLSLKNTVKYYCENSVAYIEETSEPGTLRFQNILSEYE